MENDSEKDNIFRPLSKTETAEQINFYKDLVTSVKERHLDPKTRHLYDKVEKLSYIHNKIDPRCIVKINKKLVRVEYPAEIRNVDRAIESLGRMEGIEASVADNKKRLELRYHPKNKYAKPCLSDRDSRPGLLIKVKKARNREPDISIKRNLSDEDIDTEEKYDYEVVGVSVINFHFNRLCDFQYLPLVSKGPEERKSKAEYIYDKIMPSNLPEASWLLETANSQNVEPFLLPVRFSTYDSSHSRLNMDDGRERQEDAIGLSGAFSKPVQKKPMKISTKFFGTSGRVQNTISFISFKDKDVPTKPTEARMKLLKSRALDDQLARVKQLFNERPIWTKAAIMYNTGLRAEQAKVLLPAVAYYFINGPYRILWVKFGYDPRKDPKARIYQTLDYRIRTGDSTKLKVNAKRSYTCKTALSLGPSHVKKVSLKDDIYGRAKPKLDERCYVLRPNTIPPARQMFYQFCDLLLPEVQELISRLPKYAEQMCDVKYGWLPKHFIDQCREVVNNYVLKAVQKELLEEGKVLQEKAQKEEAKKDTDKASSSLDYCSQMLSSIKQSIFKPVQIVPAQVSARPETYTDVEAVEGRLEQIDLLSDDDDDEMMTVGEIIQSSIPERMADVEEGDDDMDNASHSSDDELEIDFEAVEEIKEIIGGSSK